MCNHNCLTCVFEDCQNDKITLDEFTSIDQEDQEIALEIKIDNMPYEQRQKFLYEISPRGRERSRRYNGSEKGKARYKAYNSSEKGKEAQKKYNASDKGKKRAKVYEQSIGRKEWRKQYHDSAKYKESSQAYRIAHKEQKRIYDRERYLRKKMEVANAGINT